MCDWVRGVPIIQGADLTGSFRHVGMDIWDNNNGGVVRSVIRVFALQMKRTLKQPIRLDGTDRHRTHLRLSEGEIYFTRPGPYWLQIIFLSTTVPSVVSLLYHSSNSPRSEGHGGTKASKRSRGVSP